MRTMFSFKKIKLWLSLMISVLMLGARSSAQDCHLFLETKNGDYAPLLKIYKDDPAFAAPHAPYIQKALHNLHAYCCSSQTLDQNSPTCQQTQNSRKGQTNFPESAFLFDHLLDNHIRRWKADSTYTDLPRDPTALEWSELLSSFSNNPQGLLPTEITQHYLKYRALQNDSLLPLYAGQSLPYFSINIQNATTILSQFNSRNLRSKYLNTCSLTAYQTLKLLADKADTNQLTNTNLQCQNFIAQLINNEISYLSSLTQYKANKLTTDTLENYAYLYYGKKSNDLQLLLSRLNTHLLGVSRQIPKLIPKCN